MHYINRLEQHDDKRVQRSLNEISRHVDCYVADLRTNGSGRAALDTPKIPHYLVALISSGYGVLSSISISRTERSFPYSRTPRSRYSLVVSTIGWPNRLRENGIGYKQLANV